MSAKRLLLTVTGLALVGYAVQRTGLVCFVRQGHRPEKAGLLPGGFRCADCAEAVDNGEGHVPPVRRVFDRTHGEYTRTEAFEKARGDRW